MKQIKNVTIVGMGALGMLFGACIQETIGQENVQFLMDEARKTRHAGEVYSENGKEKNFTIVSDVDLQKSQVASADLVIVSVKYKGLPAAIELLKSAGCVGEDTILISLMNGIDSEQLLAEAFGMDKVVYCVAQGMDAMRFGSKLQYTKMGALHIGMPKDADQTNLQALIALFDLVKLPYVQEEDILYRMWAKFMLNVGVNQTCMAYGTTYSGVLTPGEAHDTFVAAMEETVKVANAEGIALGQKDIDAYIEIIAGLAPDGTPSMGQDRINKNPSEVDMFAGMMIKLAKKHDILVPANEKLYQMVKEIEKEYVK